MYYSATSLKKYISCPRKFKHMYIDKVYPIIDKPERLARGTNIHELLDYYKSKRMKFNPVLPDITLSLSDKIMAELWNIHYKNDGLTYVSSEKRFSTQIKGVKFKGILDGIVEDKFGNTCIIEHKTTSKVVNEDYFLTVNFDTQVLLYALCCKYMGYKIDYVIYDVIRLINKKKLVKTANPEYYKRDCKYGKKGDLKPGNRLEDETHSEYKNRIINFAKDNIRTHLVRREIPIEDSELIKFEKDLFQIIRSIKAGAFYKNQNACKKGRFLCDYFLVCNDEITLDNREFFSENYQG